MRRGVAVLRGPVVEVRAQPSQRAIHRDGEYVARRSEGERSTGRVDGAKCEIASRDRSPEVRLGADAAAVAVRAAGDRPRGECVRPRLGLEKYAAGVHAAHQKRRVAQVREERREHAGAELLLRPRRDQCGPVPGAFRDERCGGEELQPLVGGAETKRRSAPEHVLAAEVTEAQAGSTERCAPIRRVHRKEVRLRVVPERRERASVHQIVGRRRRETSAHAEGISQRAIDRHRFDRASRQTGAHHRAYAERDDRAGAAAAV